MIDQISVEVFQHLVGLAALELDPDQAEYLRSQLNNQLKVIQELKAIPLDENESISLHGVPYDKENSATPRPDQWKPFPNPQAILTQAPQFEDGYIIVPDIPHITLK